MLAINDALTAFALEDPQAAEVVRLRYFVGMTVPEIATALDLAPRTVDRHAIMTFFAGAPFFTQNWVGLSPSFRTEVDIHGDTAEVYIECIFLNESKAIVAERSLSGTIRKINGNWRFWRMFNNPAQPLF